MITEGQMKNVISYYFLDMMKVNDNNINHIPTHITRDTIQFNKFRAETCGQCYNNPKYKKILEVIHNSKSVKQINSVPKNTICAVDNVSLPLNNSGIQLICYTEEEKIQHIVLQEKYQTICNSYFKIRHFPQLLQKKLRDFFVNQPWFLPDTYEVHFLLKKVFSSTFSQQVYKELENNVDILDTL
jgi:hypothetical protein